MSRLLSLLLLLSIFVPAVAENYPYRNDYLWVTVPDHADWLYETGENATVDVQLLRYGVPAAGAVVTYTIGDDMLPDDRKDTVKLDKNGRATIAVGTMVKPGFRDLRLSASVDGKTTGHHIKLGFSPDRLRPFAGEPKDFVQYCAKPWPKTKPPSLCNIPWRMCRNIPPTR